MFVVHARARSTTGDDGTNLSAAARALVSLSAPKTNGSAAYHRDFLLPVGGLTNTSSLAQTRV